MWGPPGSPPAKTHADEGVTQEHFWAGLLGLLIILPLLSLSLYVLGFSKRTGIF